MYVDSLFFIVFSIRVKCSKLLNQIPIFPFPVSFLLSDFGTQVQDCIRSLFSFILEFKRVFTCPLSVPLFCHFFYSIDPSRLLQQLRFCNSLFPRLSNMITFHTVDVDNRETATRQEKKKNPLSIIQSETLSQSLLLKFSSKTHQIVKNIKGNERELLLAAHGWHTSFTSIHLLSMRH